MKLPKGLYKPLRIVKLLSIAVSLSMLSSFMFVSACLSRFSVKLYSLQTRLILEVGVSEFKSIFISHSESFSMESIISLLVELIEWFKFSKELKTFSKLGSTSIKVFLNSTYLGLFLSAHHRSLMIDFKTHGSCKRFKIPCNIASFCSGVGANSKASNF